MLAITFDGLLQPLGYSQVARVAMGLATRGFRYTILSLERDAHLADHAHVEHVRGALAGAGIEWIAERYDEGGGGRAIASNVRRATVAAHRIAFGQRIDLVHARAIHAALVGRALRATRGTPYLFDVRGYWVDEQVEEGRRFQSPASYRIAKAAEAKLYADAAGIVTLTELQADDVRAGKMGPWRDRPVVCIPTCADYDEFRPVEPGSPRPELLRDLPGDARTIAIVGSMNRSYYVDETLALARMVIERDPRWHLIVLSAQREEYERAVEAAGIPRERVRIASVPHHRMADVLPHLDWGLLLLRENFAKRGSMPTKLAEFFASGVQVIQTGCSSEVSAWVRRADAGMVLPDTSTEALERAAARAIVEAGRTAGAMANARSVSAEHFSLARGIARYADIVRASVSARARQSDGKRFAT